MTFNFGLISTESETSAENEDPGTHQRYGEQGKNHCERQTKLMHKTNCKETIQTMHSNYNSIQIETSNGDKKGLKNPRHLEIED